MAGAACSRLAKSRRLFLVRVRVRRTQRARRHSDGASTRTIPAKNASGEARRRSAWRSCQWCEFAKCSVNPLRGLARRSALAVTVCELANAGGPSADIAEALSLRHRANLSDNLSTKAVLEVHSLSSGSTKVVLEVHSRSSGLKIETFKDESRTRSTLLELRLES